jgi:hypothetical protein
MPQDDKEKASIPDTVSSVVEEMSKLETPQVRTHIMAPKSGRSKEKKSG